MHSSLRRAFRHSLFSVVFLSTIPVLLAQSNSGTVTGTVTDPSGAVVAGAAASLALAGLPSSLKLERRRVNSEAASALA